MFKSYLMVLVYVEGCWWCVVFYGYKLDEFWLYDFELNGDWLDWILWVWGICGVLIVGFMKEN